MATVCSRQKSSLHVSHSLPETTPWPGSWTFSQLLFHISRAALPNISRSPATKKKKRPSSSYQPQSMPCMGIGPNHQQPRLTQHTPTCAGQPRSRAVCFLAAVFLRAGASWGCYSRVSAESGLCYEARGIVRRDHFIPFCFPLSLPTRWSQTQHGSRMGQRLFLKTPGSARFLVCFTPIKYLIGGFTALSCIMSSKSQNSMT